MVKVFELKNIIRNRLEESGVYNSAFETQEILCHLLSCKKEKLIGILNTEISHEVYEKGLEILEKREKGYPLQYIIGRWDFMGLSLNIFEGVLIFRPDTECICEKAIEFLKERKNPKILDLCAGSGCIGISLLHYVSGSCCDFVDLFEKPVECIKSNLKLHNLEDRSEVFRKDILSGLSFLSRKYSLIISNPPYIEKGDTRLEENVLKYEPKTALFAENKGLEFYESICENSYDFLEEDGKLIFEIGQGQQNEVIKIAGKKGFEFLEFIYDIQGIIRGLVFTRGNKI
ncbi:MAG: peptide chain release factor N(5)-glutamine methyltransferase [Clostridia bacterium]|nr:peptide chain release factor N(5)-glutamine methyltransferase [Clostridia bacterium]